MLNVRPKTFSIKKEKNIMFKENPLYTCYVYIIHQVIFNINTDLFTLLKNKKDYKKIYFFLMFRFTPH